MASSSTSTCLSKCLQTLQTPVVRISQIFANVLRVRSLNLMKKFLIDSQRFQLEHTFQIRTIRECTTLILIHFTIDDDRHTAMRDVKTSNRATSVNKIQHPTMPIKTMNNHIVYCTHTIELHRREKRSIQQMMYYFIHYIYDYDIHKRMMAFVCIQYLFQLFFFYLNASVYFFFHHNVSARYTFVPIEFFLLHQNHFKIYKIINKYKINTDTHRHRHRQTHTHTHYSFIFIFYIHAAFSTGRYYYYGCIWLSTCHIVQQDILSRLYAVLCYWFSLLSSYSLITIDCYLSLRTQLSCYAQCICLYD